MMTILSLDDEINDNEGSFLVTEGAWMPVWVWEWGRRWIWPQLVCLGSFQYVEYFSN